MGAMAGRPSGANIRSLRISGGYIDSRDALSFVPCLPLPMSPDLANGFGTRITAVIFAAAKYPHLCVERMTPTYGLIEQHVGKDVCSKVLVFRRREVLHPGIQPYLINAGDDAFVQQQAKLLVGIAQAIVSASRRGIDADGRVFC